METGRPSQYVGQELERARDMVVSLHGRSVHHPAFLQKGARARILHAGAQSLVLSLSNHAVESLGGIIVFPRWVAVGCRAHSSGNGRLRPAFSRDRPPIFFFFFSVRLRRVHRIVKGPKKDPDPARRTEGWRRGGTLEGRRRVGREEPSRRGVK